MYLQPGVIRVHARGPAGGGRDMNVILSTDLGNRARRAWALRGADFVSSVPPGRARTAGLNVPRARESGPGRQPGLDRRQIAAWYAVFAGYAAMVAVFSRHADQCWGVWATGGYLLAAITAATCRCRGRGTAIFIAAAGALAGPLAWLAIRAPATADVQVVARAATLLLRHGTPYLPSAQLSAWRSYDPYLPAMTVFGLFRAVGVRGVAGDPRLWLAVACVTLLAVAFGVAAPHRVWRCVNCRRQTLGLAVFAVTTPLLALPLALGVTDPPVLALFCVALACIGAGPAAGSVAPRALGLRWPGSPRRIRPSRLTAAALAIGVACAMKNTAWPALPVIAVMLAGRDGRRAAWRFVATSAVTAGTAIAATAPAAITRPAVFLQNTVLYPLGLTRHVTSAASPLPGHLLATTGAAGHWAAICLLCAAGLTITVWLIMRRPADARAAAWRLAIGLSAMFVLAPATRWGYFAYPLGLLGWLGLTRRDQVVAEASVPARELAESAPAMAESAPAMAGSALAMAESAPVTAELVPAMAGLSMSPAVAETVPAAGHRDQSSSWR